MCQDFSEDEVVVIYVKNLRVFELIGENFICFDNGFQASGDFRFFWINLSENVELRNWDNFFEKEEDPKAFLKKLNVCRKVFKGNRKSELDLEKHFNYTLAKDMWWDISERNYLFADWARAWRNELAPKTEDELNVLMDFNKGGFFMCNEKMIGDVLNNVHSYDASSSHIGIMARKSFPCEAMVRTENQNEIVNVIKGKFHSWIGRIAFVGLEAKVDLPVNLMSFGQYVKEFNAFVLVLNEVDFSWFSKVFDWENIMFLDFYYGKRKPLIGVNKNIASLISNLYEGKDAQEKGTFARDIMKFRSELPFGQSIKKPTYNSAAFYVEDQNRIISIEKKEEFNDIRKRLCNRHGFPYQIGLWTVSYSRAELINIILEIGVENVVYADTDCVKFLGDKGIEVIERKNKEIDLEFKEIGKKYYFENNKKIGRWNDEGTCSRFKAIGVKWYLYEIDGELSVKACGADGARLLDVLKEQLDPFEFFSGEMQIENLFKGMKIDNDARQVSVFYRDYLTKKLKNEMEIYSTSTIARIKRYYWEKGE